MFLQLYFDICNIFHGSYIPVEGEVSYLDHNRRRWVEQHSCHLIEKENQVHHL